jgi:hypothetical protein
VTRTSAVQRVLQRAFCKSAICLYVIARGIAIVYHHIDNMAEEC